MSSPDSRWLLPFCTHTRWFVIGSSFALSLVGVSEEPALAMILFIHILTIILMVVPGLFVLWRNGITIRSLQKGAANAVANA